MELGAQSRMPDTHKHDDALSSFAVSLVARGRFELMSFQL